MPPSVPETQRLTLQRLARSPCVELTLGSDHLWSSSNPKSLKKLLICSVYWILSSEGIKLYRQLLAQGGIYLPYQ